MCWHILRRLVLRWSEYVFKVDFVMNDLVKTSHVLPWTEFVYILMGNIAMIWIFWYVDGWYGDDPNLLLFYGQHGDDPNWLIFWCLIGRQLFVGRLMEFTSRGRRATKEQGSPPPHKTNTIQNVFFKIDFTSLMKTRGNQRIGQQIYLFSIPSQ